MKRLLLVLLLCLCPAAAWATCASPISGKDGSGATITLGAVVDGSSNCWGGNAIVDGAAAANRASVNPAGTPGTNGLAIQGLTGGVPVPTSGADPCTYSKKATAFFNITASGASFIPAVASDYVYICQITVTTSTQTNFSIVAGTGSSVCTGGTPYSIWGNPAETAANGALIGVSATVGGGIVVGNGEATVAGGSVGGQVNYNICALITTTNSPTVNGTVLYVQTAN